MFDGRTARAAKTSFLTIFAAIVSVIAIFVSLVLVLRGRDQYAPNYLSPFSSRFQPVQVVPEQPPLEELSVKPVHPLSKNANPNELVLAVKVNGKDRAYLINTLTGPQREIFNDTLGGKAIAATW